MEHYWKNSLIQFIKFGLVGVLNNVVYYIIFIASTKLIRLHYIPANIFGFVLSVLNSYYWNNKYVFVTEKKRIWWKALYRTYVSYAGTGIVLNSALLFLWVDVCGLSVLIAPLINLTLTIPINYLCNKYWAFGGIENKEIDVPLTYNNEKEGIILQDIEEIYSREIDWEQLRGSTVLLTGPNGMLASYVMFMLIYLNEVKRMGIKIIAAARSKERFLARFGVYGSRDYVELITDSVLEPIHIDGKVDYIIHAASLASPQYYDVCPVDVLTPNVIGTYNLLNLAVEKKSKGFLMFSSSDVYGHIQGIESVTENDMGTIDPLDIHSCYSESKRMAETMCISYFHQYKVPVKSLRIWHTYAPTMDIHNDPRVFASFMKNIVNGQDIEIKSDGSGMRSFCYIADAIAGLFTILTKGKNGEAYNICNSDEFVSIRDLAMNLSELRKDVNINVTWKQRSKDEHYTENTAIGQITPSNEKLKSLGWESKYDIRSGFERVLKYLLLSESVGGISR